MQKTFEILLDVEKELYTPSNLLFNVSRNDFESVELLFTITQDEKALDLTDKTVELAIKKPSGLTVYQTVEITDAPDGKAAAKLSIQAYVEFGVHGAEVVVRNQSQIMVTCSFYFYSREAIMQADEIQSTNDWSALHEVLFELDKKPLLVDGIPTSIPDYVGQMAFDISVNKRAFIANDLTETGWQVLGAGEGGGGIIDWNSILGKPIAFPPEIHTHDFVDIQAKPAAYPPEAHNHAILDVNGLQAALDAKANSGELGAPVDHNHTILDVTGLQAALDAKADDADLAGLQTALNGKADDADLIPFILESEADAKYALKGETGGGGGAWGGITGTISAQTDLQAALDAKADDADLAAKADVADLATKADVAALDAKAPIASPSFTGNAAFNGTGAVAKFVSPSMTNALTFSFYGLDVDKNELQRGYYGIGSGSTPNTITLASTRGDVELKPKSGFVVDATAPIKESGTLLSDKYSPIAHTHTIADVTGLQPALDAKADDADIAAKANAADVYAKTETYDKTEVDAIVTGITEGGGTIVQDNLSSTSSSAALAANQGRILNETKANVADLAAKADTADLTAKANSADVYLKTETFTKTEVNTALTAKADAADLAAKANSVDVYAKTATYSKTEVDTNLATKADAAALAAKADESALTAKANSADVYLKTETYKKTEVDTALTAKANTADLAAKADSADVYPKTTTYSKTEVDTALTGKANVADLAAKADSADLAAKANSSDLDAKANSVDVYPKTTTYSKTEVDTALTAKANSSDLAAKADAVHTHTIANVTGLQTALDGKADDGDLTAKANSADVYAKTVTYSKTEVDTALTGKANSADLAAKANAADLAAKADAVHTHAFASLTAIPTTFTPPLASGLVVGGHRVGNGLAMAGEYLTVKSANGLKTDSATSYAVEIDRTVTDGWYAKASQMGGLTLWQGTQTAYDALTKDPNTLYFIAGA